MSESQLRQLNGKGGETLQKQWERVVAALRAADTADKVYAIWDLVERTSGETFRAKVSGHDLQVLQLSPQGRISKRTLIDDSVSQILEEIVDVMDILVLSTLEEIVEMIRSIDALVLQSQEKTVEEIQLSPQERISERAEDRIWSIFEAEEYREVAKGIPTELGPERIVEQIDDTSVPQVVEDLLEAVEITPQEHISERILEEFVETFDDLSPTSGGNS